MKLSVVLVLALACLAASEPHSKNRDRPRRFLLPGWDAGDSFFHNVASEVRRAWSASTQWVRHLFSWARHHPEDTRVYRVHLPHVTGVVAVIHPGGGHHHNDNDSHHHGKDGRRENSLVWDGKRLSWEHAAHGRNRTALDSTITVAHAGVVETLPLAALAKYLSHVKAGSKIRVDIQGSSWSNLRLVLRVVGRHGEDQKKSVSVLLSTVLKEIKQHQKKAHSTKSSSSSKKSSSSSKKLRWNGSSLVWADASGHGKHVRSRLRVTQDGVSQVVPFAVLARHLKTVPAGSEINFEITGHTLKDLRVLLHILGGHKQTISLLVSKLVREAEARKHGASAQKSGPVLAHVEVKPHKKGNKKQKQQAAAAVPVVQAQQV